MDDLAPGVEPMNRAQRATYALLRHEGDWPALAADLAERLVEYLEGELTDLSGPLDRSRRDRGPFVVAKHALAGVHGCEEGYLAQRGSFAWSPARARGTVAHRALELALNKRGAPAPPGELVDRALDALAEREDGFASWLRSLDPLEVAEVRGVAVDRVASFLETWPTLRDEWWPRTESAVFADLCGGRISLRGRVDLLLGRPRGEFATKVVVDLKTGSPAPVHREDLRFYALVETIRLGTPPRLVATSYLEYGRLQPEEVTEDLLWSAARRTADGTRALVELDLGVRAPTRRAGPQCWWCPKRPGCAEGSRWGSDADDADDTGDADT